MDGIRQTELPGVGTCFEFASGSGRRVGVVVRTSGRRELVVYADDDPDAVAESIDLSVAEAQALSEMLADHEAVAPERLMDGLIEGLAVDWVTVPHGFDATTIGALGIRSRTGASVVAVVHDGEVDPEPGPGRAVTAGDTVVVVGTPPAIQGVMQLLAD